MKYHKSALNLVIDMNPPLENKTVMFYTHMTYDVSTSLNTSYVD